MVEPGGITILTAGRFPWWVAFYETPALNEKQITTMCNFYLSFNPLLFFFCLSLVFL